MTLVGPGGMGKTRIACEAAVRTANDFANGTYFVPLASVASPDLVADSIASAIGLFLYGDESPRIQVINYLSGRELLLILDNFEHLMDAADLIIELLHEAPRVRILVTSRERLNIREEWILDISGLDYPQDETSDSIEHYPAIQLFLKYARRVKADFQITAANQSSVIRICRLVEGVPLGIELAASWVRVLSCQAIGDEIGRNLDFLTSSLHDVPQKHRSIRAVFDHSYNLLTEEQQQVFKKLSVFRGGFRRDAAQTVANASLMTLAALVDKSLLHVNEDDRYDMHELLRQYGNEQLNKSAAEQDQTRDCHCHYYALFLKQCWPRIIGSQIKQALIDIEIELDNLRMAWNWAIDRHKADEIEMSLDSLQFFYNERGRYQEGEQTFAHAAAAYSEDNPNMLITCTKIRVRQGSLYNVLGLFDKGNSLLRDSIRVLRQTDAYDDMAWALRSLAVLLSDNRFAPAEVAAYLEESLSIFTELNNLWGMASALNWLSIFHHREFFRRDVQGALERAEECAWQCLAIYEQLDSVWGIAAAHLNLADVAYRRKEYEKCKHYSQKSLELFRHFGSYWGISISLVLMGDASVGYGAYDEARRYSSQGLQVPFEFRSPIINFYSLNHLLLAIQIWEGEGKLEKAYELIGLLDQQHQKASSILKHHFAFKVLARLQDDLPPHLAVAVERGRVADIETMVKSIIADFSQAVTSKPSLILNQQAALMHTLSERELEILRLVAEGCSNQEIAERLVIGVSTVKKHINHIYDKLDAKNRTQAVALARERQLLT